MTDKAWADDQSVNREATGERHVGRQPQVNGKLTHHGVGAGLDDLEDAPTVLNSRRNRFVQQRKFHCSIEILVIGFVAFD